MTRKERIEALLATLTPTALQVLNESDAHAGPPGRESHFRVRVVSPAFDGQNRVARHRTVNKTLAELLTPGGIHALAIEAYTPDEWAKRNGEGQQSPDCEGRREEAL